MKILLVSHSSNLGGGERAFVETLQALYTKGHELYVVFPKEGPLIELCKNYLVDYKIIKQKWWLHKRKQNLSKKIELFFSLIKNILRNRALIRCINPDIVITNTSVIPATAIAALLTKKKHIWYIHEIGDTGLGFFFTFGRKFSFKLIDLLSDQFIFNSHFLQSYYSNHFDSKKSNICRQPVILNPITSERNASTEIFTVILVGRFAPNKGQLEASQAIHRLKTEGKEIKLLLIGAGDDPYSLQTIDYVQKNQLENNIEIIPFTKDVASYYQQADVALVCSLVEAFGRISIEAMKMGMPVIASDTGANNELIINSFNGYLYKYKNIDDLAAKIAQMEDKPHRIHLAHQAKNWANENYNLKNYIDDLEAVLAKLIL